LDLQEGRGVSYLTAAKFLTDEYHPRDKAYYPQLAFSGHFSDFQKTLEYFPGHADTT
jgi:hypothetical protein